jgi:hypothetical protein
MPEMVSHSLNDSAHLLPLRCGLGGVLQAAAAAAAAVQVKQYSSLETLEWCAHTVVRTGKSCHSISSGTHLLCCCLGGILQVAAAAAVQRQCSMQTRKGCVHLVAFKTTRMLQHQQRHPSSLLLSWRHPASSDSTA